MAPDILAAIGGTRLLPLRQLAPAGGARILIKMESENPTGSMKDRMALAIVRAARADGRLRLGGPVVEYTGGSTGVSLALVCAALGHPLDIVTSDAFQREKLDHMRILGARLQVLPSDGGRMTAELTRAMIAAAGGIAAGTGAFWVDQMRNPDPLPAYGAMADELLDQAGGAVDALVQSVGTAASLRGMAGRLRERCPAVHIVAVEPEESPVLSGGAPGGHGIDGVGAGFVVPLWREGIADGIERVSTDEAIATALRLARTEALFAGTSTGANVAAAIRVARRLGPGHTVATILCDTGMKYLGRFGPILAGQPV
ncbi:cysteine synthase [Allostella sp. ATCC 35155]|nr:cysteine synthase [Stella sp. ATCC 35155]